MSPPKETFMVLKVDLDCLRCYKKVKKLLCSFPQIKDQIYNEKQNAVMIKVVCCSPEKILDKLCSKGRKSIRSIEILEPKKPATPPPSRPADEPPPTKLPPEPAPEPAQAPALVPPPRRDPPKPTPLPAPMPEPVPCYPANVCCSDCYNGRNTGPCYRGYGVPPTPPPATGGWYYDCPPGGFGYGYWYYYRPGYRVS